MLFNSVEFLIFFPIVCLLYFILPHRIRHIWLIISSLVFVAFNEPFAVVFLLLVTLITWGLGLLIAKAREKDKDAKSGRIFVVIGLFTIFGILAYVKYVPYILSLFKAGSVEVILPIGISFYTFSTATYLIDVYKGECEPCGNILKYAAYATFFPTILSGPIERAKNMIPQFDEVHTPDYDRMKDGLKLMLWGYFLKMVIVSRLTILTDTVYADDAAFTGISVLIAILMYSFQIYCDFAGYSFIAIGCARVCGFNVMRNFRQPYLAKSVADFWRRWHISLSSWFKDYLYIPLGGNRKGTFRKYLNVMIVFAVSGIWHGANVTFLIWGLMNGAYQVIGGLVRSLMKKLKLKEFPGWLSVIWTYLLISFTWVFFSADSFNTAISIIGRVFSGNFLAGFSPKVLYDMGLGTNNLVFVLAALAILIVADFICEKKKCDISELLTNTAWPVRLAVYWILVTMILFSTNLSTQEFLYMNF